MNFEPAQLSADHSPTTKPAPSKGFWYRLAAVHVVLAGMPFLAEAALYALSWRAEAVLGYWPQPLLDDLRGILTRDFLFALLYNVTCVMYSSALSLAAIVALLFLPWLFSYSVPHWWRVALIFIYLAGLLLLFTDPGQRLMWLLD